MPRVLPLIALALLLSTGFGSIGRNSYAREHTESFVGVVSAVDVVGKGVEVETVEASGRTHREWFRVGDSTVIWSRGRIGSIADLRAGEEVALTYFPARVPHTAERLDVR